MEGFRARYQKLVSLVSTYFKLPPKITHIDGYTFVEINEIISALKELHRQASAATSEIHQQLNDIMVTASSPQDDITKCDKLSRTYGHHIQVVASITDLNYVIQDFLQWDEYVREHTNLSGALMSDRWVSKVHNRKARALDYEEEDFFVDPPERTPTSRPGCKAPFDPKDGKFGTFLKRRGNHFYDEDFYESFDEVDESDYDQYDDYPDDDD
jgi:hypothetical protein